MIVVDSNVMAYLWIRQDATLSRLADSVRAKDHVWAAPSLWKSEFRNVLASHMRFRAMTTVDAKRLAQRAETITQLRIVPVQSTDVLGLVSDSGCSAYDCEYVAAARATGTKLVTGDRRLAAAFPETAVTMEEFVGA